MTAFALFLQKDKFFVAMDSLAINSERKDKGVCNKILPHMPMKGVICGTGNAEAIYGWYRHIQLEGNCRSVDELHQFTIKSFTEDWVERESILKHRIKLFHIGLDSTGVFDAYYYLVEAQQFTHAKINLGFTSEPPITLDFDLPSSFDDDSVITFLNSVVVAQKRDDDRRTKRVGIGGHIVTARANANEIVFKESSML